MLITLDTQQYNLSENYIREVLGLDSCLLQEGVLGNTAVQRLIIKEHLLFEGFWSDMFQKGKDFADDLVDKGKARLMDAAEGIKKFGKGAWGVMSALYSVIKNGNIAMFVGSVWRKSIKAIFNALRATFKWLEQKLPEWNMPTFAKGATKALELLESVRKKMGYKDGWKSVITIAGIAIGFHWIWDKIGDWVLKLADKVGINVSASLNEEDSVAKKVSEEVKEWILDSVEEKITEFAKGSFMKIIEKLTGALLGNVKVWWDTAVEVAGGAKLVIKSLGKGTETFLSKSATKAGLLGNKRRNESICRDEESSEALLRETTRRIILESRSMLL